ncbi:molybdopterin-guanine dinucleotide biosynthesis protein [Arthrobacter sp. SW1]|uniref:molybdenum cofactor guanylyltransferase n=1 Tax=Arthrobacter sp. SW1 TaxID=1920889 RepID=UPI000877B883|nr:NTP transferase domain-containing protein [Arthrobacter sp. SW1]OFI39193.1 molybdopterin-guanine dinucleotide biosynthesis protein [Arthrobacter sp. SW1]
MEFDAVVLAGGRSSRLGGVPKAGLLHDGVTLLERALAAARGAGSLVVVGPRPATLPAGVLTAREEPPFAGPAAAIAAGLAALEQDAAERGRPQAPWLLVLACDMPHAGSAVPALFDELREHPGADGVLALSPDGRKQPLLAVYSTAALQRSISARCGAASLTNAPVFSLLASLEMLTAAVPDHAADDVDTWDDAAALGVHGEPS